jgi:hypothetical protein
LALKLAARITSAVGGLLASLRRSPTRPRAANSHFANLLIRDVWPGRSRLRLGLVCRGAADLAQQHLEGTISANDGFPSLA